METLPDKDNARAQGNGSDAAIEKAVFEELAGSLGSLAPGRLARGAGARARVPEYRVMDVLRVLLEQGRLVLQNGKVRALRSTPVDRAARRPQKTRAPRDWNFFRRLLPYYIHCLRADDGIECMTFDDQQGKDFTYLYRTGQWYPRQGQAWILTLSLDGGDRQVPSGQVSPGEMLSEGMEHLSSLWSQGRDDLVLGYPVYASIVETQGQKHIRLVPIFLHQIHHEPCAGGMELTLLNQAPILNHAWMAECLPRSRQRRFLQLVGMDDPIDDLTGDGARGQSLDFGALAPILESFVRHLVREPLNPRLVLGTPLALPLEPGIYNRALVVSAQKTRYTAGLIRELEEIAKAPDEMLEHTALKYFFLDAKADHPPMHEGAVADTMSLSPEQRRAVASLLSMPLTVVQGPPGTGKSQVAAAACANARLLGQSVLVSSSNHKPLDALMEKLALDGGENLAVRCNARESNGQKYGFADAVETMLSQSASAEDETRFQSLREELRGWLDARSLVVDQARNMAAWKRRLGELDKKIARIATFLPGEIQEKARTLPPLSRRKIARMGAAALFLDELGKSGTTLFRGFLKRPLTALSTRRLLRRLEKLDPRTPIPKWFGREDPAVLEAMRERLSWAGELFEALWETEEIRQAIDKTGIGFEDLVTRLSEISKHVAEQAAPLLLLDTRRRKGVRGNRQCLANLARLPGKSASRRGFAADHEAENLAREILRHTPVWTASSLSVGSYIPLSPGIFDLALIDEASQSNIPSIIPLLFRARRAGVIGDSKQLPVITNLSPDDDVALMRRYHPEVQADLRLSFSASSAYDLAHSLPAASPFFLDETWRSAFSIARYSSELFYDGQLAVATDERALRRPKGMAPGIEWRDVRGEIVREPGRGNYCPAEVDEVERLVCDILKTRNFLGTLGVVTPFREQAERIRERLQNIPDLEHEKRARLAQSVGTAHAFQGDERDVMIFSLCAGPGLVPSSLNFLRNEANLFNVAVSRARSILLIVGNRAFARACGIPHVVALAEGGKSPAQGSPQNPWAPFESPWEKRLHDALEERGINVVPQYRVRARRLDLALVDPDNPMLRIDIEVDGDCHFTARGTVRADDHWRDLTLRELGWRVLRFWTFELKENMNGCLARVEQARDEMLGKSAGSNTRSNT